ncbi:MAG: Tol-Pal system beta propeller repeat protein TolB [Myxococcota bacterium]
MAPRAGWVGLVAVVSLVVAASAAAQGHPAVVVTPGKRQAFKVAVQRFEDVSAEERPERAVLFRDVLTSALEYSSVFDVIDPRAFLGPQQTQHFSAGRPIACSDWSTIGSDAFVEGEIRVASSRYAVEFRVWDTATCKRLLRKRYRQSANLAPDILAKRVADDVSAVFTGVRGVASTEITFVSDRTGNKEILAMDADGGRPRAITANRSINTFPSWSPDGASIVFTSYRHLNMPNLFITTRGKGKPRRLLTGMGPDRSQYRGVFDPVGKSLAVVMSSKGATEIYTVWPSARKIRQLTRNKSIDVSPSWSPNGEQIAFVSDRAGAPQVYIMDANGRNARRLTFNGSYNTAPAWSPDGKWIAYETRVAGQFDIWLISVDGSVNVPLVSHPRSDESPSWAPNSRKLAFSSTRRGRSDIYVIDVNGGEPLRLTKGAGNDTSPAWGPFPR